MFPRLPTVSVCGSGPFLLSGLKGRIEKAAGRAWARARISVMIVSSVGAGAVGVLAGARAVGR